MAFQINVHKIGVLLSADGYITFEASDKKGNAVIAAKDGDGSKPLVHLMEIENYMIKL